ncbi:hypothetical protein GCM10020366_44380 [Saccharopolyspora gregorii]|uniref:DUF397 domain-containing protein n=1 Tax=Saccharopolyspora gregorii TaxID=33914 RepID=A0ABP6RU78_9PSEU
MVIGLEQARWFTSSYTSNAAACVEVAMTASVVGVRDTKDRAGGTLVVPREQWRAFLHRIVGDRPAGAGGGGVTR